MTFRRSVLCVYGQNLLVLSHSGKEMRRPLLLFCKADDADDADTADVVKVTDEENVVLMIKAGSLLMALLQFSLPSWLPQQHTLLAVFEAQK